MTTVVGVRDSNVVFETGVLTCLAEDSAIQASLVNGTRIPEQGFDVAVVSVDFVEANWALCPLIVCAGPREPIGELAAKANVAAILDRSTLAPDQLRGAVHAVASGLRLTQHRNDPRELDQRSIDVLSLLADGASTQEISADLGYSERTVKAVISRIGARLGSRSRAHAVATALRMQLIH